MMFTYTRQKQCTNAWCPHCNPFNTRMSGGTTFYYGSCQYRPTEYVSRLIEEPTKDKAIVNKEKLIAINNLNSRDRKKTRWM